jgi:transposase InsO family protein
VTDLTHVQTWAGTAYVSFITDVFSRFIVGWRVAANMATPMVLETLEMARTLGAAVVSTGWSAIPMPGRNTRRSVTPNASPTGGGTVDRHGRGLQALSGPARASNLRLAG